MDLRAPHFVFTERSKGEVSMFYFIERRILEAFYTALSVTSVKKIRDNSSQSTSVELGLNITSLAGKAYLLATDGHWAIFAPLWSGDNLKDREILDGPSRSYCLALGAVGTFLKGASKHVRYVQIYVDTDDPEIEEKQATRAPVKASLHCGAFCVESGAHPHSMNYSRVLPDARKLDPMPDYYCLLPKYIVPLQKAAEKLDKHCHALVKFISYDLGIIAFDGFPEVMGVMSSADHSCVARGIYSQWRKEYFPQLESAVELGMVDNEVVGS
jgi:hypothetical protein